VQATSISAIMILIAIMTHFATCKTDDVEE